MLRVIPQSIDIFLTALLLALQNGDGTDSRRTVDMGVTQLGIAGHLVLAGLPAQLQYIFVDLAQTRRRQWARHWPGSHRRY